MIPFDTLAELFAIATEPWGLHQWYRVEPPTATSIDRIQHQLGVTLPDEYVQLATRCASYGGWLGGIGEDYDHPFHILRLNAVFHAGDELPALPEHFVLLNHGHDGDCDCWDTREATVQGQYPIVYVDLEGGTLGTGASRFADFRSYIEDFVMRQAPQSGDERQRRRARRLIAELSDRSVGAPPKRSG